MLFGAIDLNLILAGGQASDWICPPSQVGIGSKAVGGVACAALQNDVDGLGCMGIVGAAETELRVAGSVLEVIEIKPIVDAVVRNSEAAAKNHLGIVDGWGPGEAQLGSPVVVIRVEKMVAGREDSRCKESSVIRSERRQTDA